MSPLGEKLISRIRAYGPMTVAQYMEACLSDPVYGYYMRREPFGRYGDFVTAPEVSQMFGELIGLWTVVTWEAMGSPRAFVLAELGPGRGTLMADLLRAARVDPAFVRSVSIHLVETSPVLRRAQEERLSQTGVAVHWHSSVDEVPAGAALIVANEFFDALPVKQFVRTATGWHERLVGIDATGKPAFGLAPNAMPPDLLPDWARAAATGEVVEVSPARRDVARAIGARIEAAGGAALIIDYGHVRSAPGDTLQAVRAHRHCDILDCPGTSDLTSHVDFEALGLALQGAGAAVHGPLTQGAFLSAMGLAGRAEVLKRHKDAATSTDIDAAVSRLAADSEMGHLFKVIAATPPDCPPPYPFGSPEA